MTGKNFLGIYMLMIAFSNLIAFAVSVDDVEMSYKLALVITIGSISLIVCGAVWIGLAIEFIRGQL